MQVMNAGADISSEGGLGSTPVMSAGPSSWAGTAIRVDSATSRQFLGRDQAAPLIAAESAEWVGIDLSDAPTQLRTIFRG